MADTILIVEDEIFVRMTIADHLRDAGFRIVEAGDVSEAIEQLYADPRISVVFTDVQMPGDQDGFDLTRWILANLPHVKVIITSGKINAADLAAGLCHAGPLIEKPYYLHDVLARIQSVLNDNIAIAAI